MIAPIPGPSRIQASRFFLFIQRDVSKYGSPGRSPSSRRRWAGIEKEGVVTHRDRVESVFREEWAGWIENEGMEPIESNRRGRRRINE